MLIRTFSLSVLSLLLVFCTASIKQEKVPHRFSQYVIHVDSTRFEQVEAENVTTDSGEKFFRERKDGSLLRVVAIRMQIDPDYNFSFKADTTIDGISYVYYAYETKQNSDNLLSVSLPNSVLVDTPEVTDEELVDDYEGQVLLLQANGTLSLSWLANFAKSTVRVIKDAETAD